MPPDVHSVALIIHGAGEPSQAVALLQHDRLDAGAGKQLVGRRQPGRSGPDDDCALQNRNILNCVICPSLFIPLPYSLSICHVGSRCASLRACSRSFPTSLSPVRAGSMAFSGLGRIAAISAGVSGNGIGFVWTGEGAEEQEVVERALWRMAFWEERRFPSGVDGPCERAPLARCARMRLSDDEIGISSNPRLAGTGLANCRK